LKYSFRIQVSHSKRYFYIPTKIWILYLEKLANLEK